MDINDLTSLAESNRAQTLIDRLEGLDTRGDFAGSVTGTWIRLDESGAGVVAYNDKEYKTKRIGSSSIPKGTSVELTFAKGIYYSKW